MKSTSRSSKRKSKRSQKHSKMKTRSSREKPKKLKQQDHSVSGSSDGDDSIPKSVSSSSLVEENNNRIKKRGRSRDGRRRKDKKRRKRIRLLSDSSGDDSPIVKKVKKSKKSRGFDSRKKRNLKRRRRDRSVSSSSIHSLNDDGDGEFEGKEEKGEVKEQKRREKSKVRKRRRRDRSVSSSSSRSRGRSSEPNEDFEEKEEKVEVKERKGKEKGKKRKGRRRDHSISSSSSRSRSRYVYDENDNCERELEGKEEKLKLKEQKRRDKGKEMNARKRKGDMSRSCSPCSLHSESISYHSEERELEKNNPKRLKSVIVVMKESEVAEEQTSNRDDGRDEIVCEFNDYPNKSNDSNDGVCGKESGSHSHHVSSEKRPLEEPNRKFVASDARVSEVTVVRKNDAEGSVGKSPCYVRSEADDLLMGNRSEASKSEVGLNHEDLETILRQKALENLLKRKGKLSTNFPTDTKGDHDIEMKKSSIVKAQPVDLCLLQDEENTKYMHKEEKHTDHVKFISNSHSPSRDSDGRLLSLEVETAYPDEKGKSPGIFVNSRPNVGISALRKEPLGAKNTWKRQLSLQEKSPKKFSPPREILANNSKQPLNSQEISLPNLSAPQEISMDSTSPRFVPKGSTEYATTVAASEPSASGEQHTNDKTNEADEKGQFQQKTMSVMRGGEMVQVSYKVYIPKKAPTLSRGKLKR